MGKALTKQQAGWIYGWKRRINALARLQNQLNRTGRYTDKSDLSQAHKDRILKEINNIENKTTSNYG